jgi:hypothetical protein
VKKCAVVFLNTGSGAGTPNTKKGGPGYLAEHWETLTSALEAAASNQSRNTSLRLRAGSMDDSGSSQASTTHGGGSGASSEPSSANTTHRRTSFSNRAVEATEADSKPRTPVEQKKFADKRLNHYDEYKRLQVSGWSFLLPRILTPPSHLSRYFASVLWG